MKTAGYYFSKGRTIFITRLYYWYGVWRGYYLPVKFINELRKDVKSEGEYMDKRFAFWQTSNNPDCKKYLAADHKEIFNCCAN